MLRIAAFALCLSCALPARSQPSIRVDVRLVRIPVVATDADGKVVHDLRREEFAVTEDGVPQEIKYLWRDIDLPLNVGLIADDSNSQMGFIRKHRDTMAAFLRRVVSPSDRAFIVSVASQQVLVTDLTQSTDELAGGIASLKSGNAEGEILGEPCGTEKDDPEEHHRKKHAAPLRRRFPCGGTALWNGVYYSAKLKLKPLTGRKALLVLTDGWDTGSDHGLEDTIEACQGADAVVYAFRTAQSPYLASALNPAAAPLLIPLMKSKLAKGKRELERLTLETGGATFTGSPEDAFVQIEAELRGQYVLAYTPASTAKPGATHKLKVTVARPGLRVRARATYTDEIP
ncbi:MAG TPA: VWA domain-containing protein [Bryobacteraceae bacterium]|nr:VWA domain-containing protein [Bryobacteraceae bacterium]